MLDPTYSMPPALPSSQSWITPCIVPAESVDSAVVEGAFIRVSLSGLFSIEDASSSEHAVRVSRAMPMHKRDTKIAAFGTLKSTENRFMSQRERSKTSDFTPPQFVNICYHICKILIFHDGC